MVRWKYRLRLPPGTPAQSTSGRQPDPQFPDAGLEIRTRDKASPGLDRFVSRMGQFLASWRSPRCLIAGIGIGNGVSSYLEGAARAIATLKILGATGADVARIFCCNWAWRRGWRLPSASCWGGDDPLIGLALKGFLPSGKGWCWPRALALAGVQGR
jgi:putative ABC transport system permease protein